MPGKFFKGLTAKRKKRLNRNLLGEQPPVRAITYVSKFDPELESASSSNPLFVPAMAKGLSENNDEDCRRVIDSIADAIDNRLSEKKNEDDDFEGEKRPSVSLNEYLFRLVQFMDKWYKEEPHVKSAGMRSLFLSVVYINHLQETVPGFEINKYNVHRLFLASMLIAAKFAEDKPISNKYWGKVGGVEVDHLNELESSFCLSSKYNLFVDDDELEKIYDEYQPTIRQQ